MKNKILAIIGALGTLVLIGAGCASTPVAPSASHESEPSAHESSEGSEETEQAVGNHGDAGGHIARLAGSRIDLANRNSFKPGEVTFSFKLYGLDGHVFGPDDLKIAHEKRMHFLLVRDDMTGFQHIHPEYLNNQWTVKTNIKEAGQYELYVDIAPEEEKPVVLRVPVTIGGPTATKNFPTPNIDQSAEEKPYTATLVTGGIIKTNEHTKLAFTLRKNGQSVTDVGPYLGAYGHAVLIRHTDPDDFFHVHPLTETKPANGVVEFEAEFPTKGRYTIYAQFSLSGGVRTFPITVDVNEEGQDTVVHEKCTGAHCAE